MDRKTAMQGLSRMAQGHDTGNDSPRRRYYTWAAIERDYPGQFKQDKVKLKTNNRGN